MVSKGIDKDISTFDLIFSDLNSKELRAKGSVKNFIEETVKMNSKIFVAQRSLYSKGLDYAFILREQAGRSDEEIFDKLNTMFKEINVDKQTRISLINSIANKVEPPRFVPYVLGNKSFEKFRKDAERQGFDELEIDNIVDTLLDGFDKVRQQFEGRSLGIAIREE